MTYTIEQTIGKNIYLYEVVAYWDKGKKQARQKRIYLGKKDASTGKAVTPRKDKHPQAVRDYGHFYTLKKIAEQLGLETLLQKSFPDCWEKIIGLVYYRLLENKAFYLQKLWSETTCIEESYGVSSQNISKLMHKLGGDGTSRFNFLEQWIAKRSETKCFFFDITSLSSYSNNIDFAEWGYNRDGDKLPQVNLGILQAHPDGLPLMYQLYPGSIADVSTLKNIVKQAVGLKLKIDTMVMDKGFYSMGNLQELEEHKIKFITPLPMTTKISKALLSKHQAKLTSPVNAFHRKGGTTFYLSDRIEISGNTFTVHLYLNEQKRLEEINCLFRRLDDLEMQVSKNNFSDKDDVVGFMNRTMKGSSKFYTVRIKGDTPILTRKRNALTFRMNHAGKFILLTNNHELTRDEILSIYRQRDGVEKLFDVIKNEIDDARLRVHSRESAEGSLFILFIAAILHAELSRRMKLGDLFKKYTIAEVFGEMKKLRVVNMSYGATHITEISKKQRALWDTLGIPYPIAPSY